MTAASASWSDVTESAAPPKVAMNWITLFGLAEAIAVPLRATSPGTAYAGLGLYVVAEAILFVPLLWMAVNFSTPEVLPSAAVTTVILFGGLTGIVFLTRTDFSFLKGILGVAALAAMAYESVSRCEGAVVVSTRLTTS